jgi:hypothetical protein
LNPIQAFYQAELQPAFVNRTIDQLGTDRHQFGVDLRPHLD